MRDLSELQLTCPGNIDHPFYDQSLLEVAEEECQVQFPESYIEFLKHSNGGETLLSEFPVSDTARTKSIFRFFGLTDRVNNLRVTDDYGIADNTTVLRQNLEDSQPINGSQIPIESVVAIGDDGGGDFYFIDTTHCDAPVYYFCHDPEYIELINPTFEGFIDSLYNEEEESD